MSIQSLQEVNPNFKTLFQKTQNTIKVIFIASFLFVSFSATDAEALSSVSVGELHSLEVRTDGTLWSWGYNAYGQLGLGDLIERNTPVQVGTDTDWSSVSALKYHTVGIKTDGTLWSWGYNIYGQLGLGDTTDRNTPVQVETDADWSSVSAGGHHTVAIKTDGTLWSWGYNASGQLGLGDSTDRTSPVQVGTDTDWSSVSAGANHIVGIKTGGTLWSWGWNFYAQLGLGDSTDRTSPVQVGTDTSWYSVSTTWGHTVGIKTDGTLWSWGLNLYGQLGFGDTTTRTSPLQVGTDTSWSSVSGGDNHSLAIKTDGTLWSWGYNIYGQLGLGDTTTRTSPVQVGTDTGWSSVSGDHHSLAIKTDDTLWSWGRNQFGQLGDGTIVDKTTPVQIGGGWKLLAGGKSHSGGVRLNTNATLWTWGYNSNGQLGDGTTVNKNSPVQVGTDADWASVSMKFYHTLGLRTDGTLWAWGDNSFGCLGDGTTTERHSPVQIGTDTDWSSIGTGTYLSVALKTDGTLWAWGYNYSGQHGDGTTDNKTSPGQIGTDTDWDFIAVGNEHTVAMKTDGSLWAWGFNAQGQIGDGSIDTERYSPVQVGTDTDWEFISTGNATNMALKADGTLWGWGYNLYGQIGIGTTTFSEPIPVQVGLDTNWSLVSAGEAHTLALKTDGTLWAWGENSDGQLGDGTNVSKTSPVQIGIDTDWDIVIAGEKHSFGLKTDGSLWVWGVNDYGQLGDGTTVDKNTPLKIGFYRNTNAVPQANLDFTTVDDGTNGGNDTIAGVSRNDGGADANNRTGGNSEPQVDLKFKFSVFFVDDSGETPVQPKLYIAHKSSPVEGLDGDFFPYDLTCAGASWSAGKTCERDLRLPPQATTKFYFAGTKTDATPVRLPVTGYNDGPTVQLLRGYNMLSIPRDIDAESLTASAFGSGHPVYRWVSTGLDEGDYGGYWEMVNAANPLIQGESYFVIRSNSQIPENGAYADELGGIYTINLQTGWNMVANPYNGALNLTDTQIERNAEGPVTWETAAVNGWVTNSIYYWNGDAWGSTYSLETSGGAEEAVLTPWLGYWIYVAEETQTYKLIITKPAQ